MATSYAQTGTAADCGTIVACSGATLGDVAVSRKATVGGSSGAEFTFGGAAFDNALSRALVMFEIVPESGDTWDAGDYVVRLNVTTVGGVTASTWTETHICRVNSSCVSQESIGSLTGQSTALTVGLKTMTVAGAAQTPSAGDKIYIVCVFLSNRNNSSGGITPDQNIDTPVTAGAGGGDPEANLIGGKLVGRGILGGVLVR